MPDIVDTSTTVRIVRSFNVVSAHRCSLRAESLVAEASQVGSPAQRHLVLTAVDHFIGEHGIVIDRVIECLDAVRVVICEAGVIWCLNGFVDDTVDNEETAKLDRSTLFLAALDLLGLVVDVVLQQRPLRQPKSFERRKIASESPRMARKGSRIAQNS